MKLSIITVCFNIKNEIERTCESIINQTCQDFEWIVIDGGSTDGTLDILGKYKSRINILVSENDNGIYHAMNKGIKCSNGKYLNFMNGGDCFYSNNVLENAIKYFNTNADVYYSNVEFVSINAEKTITSLPHTIIKEFFIHNNITHQSTFVKRELFDKYGCYGEGYKIVSDYEKWITLIKDGCNFEYINFIIATCYQDGISTTDVDTHSKEREKVVNKYFVNNVQKLIKYFFRIRTKNNKKRYLLFNVLPIISTKEYYCSENKLQSINITTESIFEILNDLIVQAKELNKLNVSNDEYKLKFEIIIDNLLINIIGDNILNNYKLYPYLYDAFVSYKDLILLNKLYDDKLKNNTNNYFKNKPINYDDVLNIEKLIINNKYQKKKKIYLFGFLPITK